MGVLCIAIALPRYGWEFVEETYLYHFTRVDNRHNFSVHFLGLYLSYASSWRQALGLLAFVPQVATTASLGCLLHRDLPLAMFAQTLGFVALNKVCTVQVRRCEGCAARLSFTVSCACATVPPLRLSFFVCGCGPQYFLWYLCLLPLVLPRVNLPTSRLVVLAVAWMGAQVRVGPSFPSCRASFTCGSTSGALACLGVLSGV